MVWFAIEQTGEVGSFHKTCPRTRRVELGRHQAPRWRNLLCYVMECYGCCGIAQRSTPYLKAGHRRLATELLPSGHTKVSSHQLLILRPGSTGTRGARHSQLVVA